MPAKRYESLLVEIGLQADPFLVEAPEKVDYWAENQALLESLIRTYVDSLISDASAIYILWGFLGTGKTHSMRYLSNTRVQEKIREKLGTPKGAPQAVSIAVTTPVPARTGELTNAVYQQLLKALLGQIDRKALNALGEIAAKKEMGPPYSILRVLNEKYGKQTSLVRPRRLLRAMEGTEEWKYLVDLRSRKYGKLSSTVEMATVLSLLVQSLVRVGSRVFVWIDELEHLSSGTGTERQLFSDLIRKLFDDTDEGLTIFLVFTLNTLEKVRELLLPALWSRISEERKVEFEPLEKKEEIEEYFREVVQAVGKTDPREFIEDSALRRIVGNVLQKYAPGDLVPRNLNVEFKSILTAAYLLHRRFQPKKRFKLTDDLLRRLEREQTTMVEEIARELRGSV